MLGSRPGFLGRGLTHENDHALAKTPAGVARLRLSQSREAPPAPVVMPGDMMPKPPGNRVDSPVRGHRTRPAAGKSPSRRRPYRASIEPLGNYNKDDRQEYRLFFCYNIFGLWAQLFTAVVREQNQRPSFSAASELPGSIRAWSRSPDRPAP
jgi:hypothetical protein